MSDKVKDTLFNLVKGLTILFLAALWIWTLWPAPDQPIGWDGAVQTAMGQKNIPIYEISGFDYIQSETSFEGREISTNDNAPQFIRNTTAGVVLMRLIDRSHNLVREFHFLPADRTQKIQKYVEIYAPPPSYFAYEVEESKGVYHFGKSYYFVIFAIVLTFMVYVFLSPHSKDWGSC